MSDFIRHFVLSFLHYLAVHQSGLFFSLMRDYRDKPVRSVCLI